MPQLSQPAPGTIIGQYRIIREIGAGGMGVVFEAVHLTLDRRAAIKLLLPQYARNPALSARFLREAKAANRVQHPSVVQIVEFGHLSDGAPYYVMEYLDGETLASRLRSGKMRWLDGLFTIRQVAAVLAAAHRENLIHRDLKPANIMLIPDPEVPGGERAKVLDFGIAKLLEEEPDKVQLTKTGALLGTPHYMAPEQWRHEKKMDGKVDVYALGVISFEILAGQLPFDADAPLAIGMQHLLDEPPKLAALAPNVNPEVASLVQRMLAKAALDRPNMSEVSDVLNRLFVEWSGNKARSSEHVPLTPRRQGFDLSPMVSAVDLEATRKYPPHAPASGAKLVEPSPPYARPEATTQRTADLPAIRPIDEQPSPPLVPPRSSRIIVLSVIVAFAVVVGIGAALRPGQHLAKVEAEQQLDGSVGIIAAPSDSAVFMDLSAPADLAETVDEAKPTDLSSGASKAPVRSRCVPMSPNSACVLTGTLSAAQKKSVIDALHDAGVRLCPGEKLRATVSFGRVVVTAAPSSVTGDIREILINSLLGRLDTRSFTGDVEVRCAPR